MRDVILMRGVHVASLSGDAALRRHRHVTAARLMRYAVHELRRIHVRASARSVPLRLRTVRSDRRLQYAYAVVPYGSGFETAIQMVPRGAEPARLQ